MTFYRAKKATQPVVHWIDRGQSSGAGGRFHAGQNGYLELRRAFMRARRDAAAAPAEPTSASTTVGFSGELAQPSVFPIWACSEAVRRKKPADATRERGVFFIRTLNAKATVLTELCQRPKAGVGVPSSETGRPRAAEGAPTANAPPAIPSVLAPACASAGCRR